MAIPGTIRSPTRAWSWSTDKPRRWAREQSPAPQALVLRVRDYVHSRVPDVAEVSVAEPDNAAVLVLVVLPSEFSVSKERSYLTPVYSMCFWVEPSASKETFIWLLLAPQAGLVIVPMMPLPVRVNLEKLMHTTVEATGVNKTPGLPVLVVIRWKAPLIVTVC